MAGYWLFTAVVLFAVVTLVHFVGAFGPSSNPEIVSKMLIMRPDGGNLYFGFCNRITFNCELRLLS